VFLLVIVTHGNLTPVLSYPHYFDSRFEKFEEVWRAVQQCLRAFGDFFWQAFVSILVSQPLEAWQTLKVATCSTVSVKQVEKEVGEGALAHANDFTEVFRRWGCTDNDIAQIFARGPSLRRSDLNQLQNKLHLLQGLGITSPDLVKIINCRPRFLKCWINNNFHEQIESFLKIFESKEVLVKAIVRNPSLLTYDFHSRVKSVISQYEEMGLSKKDLILMLISRPTLIPRTSFNDEKMEYIQKTGLSQGDKMFKYVVTIIGISRLETIRHKVANLEKFGFTEDEIFALLGRSPLILTLSVDKVQRNMTFILCTLKLPAKVILNYPFLLYFNLDAVLKPRVHLLGKMEEMGLHMQIKGHPLLRALRMTEKRFLKKFIYSQPKDVADELMQFYQIAKGIKRLGETSRKISYRGFPF
ncbi:uncharacterized protein LOC120073205, partial [Benincasa hispida]|uniref:uncharacterized protein LOC120073205 n=1 Tax=Benincasa hispida TaxID=102211 RepID=UPI0018FFA9B8